MYELLWNGMEDFTIIFFLYSKTNIVFTLNFFNSLSNSFNLVLITGLVLFNRNSGSKRFKSQHYSDLHNYQKNLIAHMFLLHQVLLERYKAI